MINFKDFITEAAKPVEGEGKKLTHLIHAEDSPIHLGDAGVAHVGNVLDNTDAALRGKKSKMPIKTKIDGAPSLVFGYHPENGQPFVATKSAFNKTPKINYSHEDIDANHGHAPGLAAKLHDALNHVNKILPPARKVGGRYPDQVFQGDLIHSGKKDIKKEEDGKISYQPNTIKYKTDSDNAEGQKALSSKIGIAVHTKYKGRDMASMRATPDIGEKDLIEHPDVHQVSTDVNIDPSKYTPEMQRAYKEHIENAKATYSKMMKDPESLNFLNGHNIDLEAHINDMVRKDGKPSVEGYLQHLQSKAARETEKVKTEASKQKIADNYNQKMAHIVANKKRLQSVLDLHGHLQKAKNVLVDALDKNSVYDNEAGGQKVGHEGYVVNGDTKLVDRETFSRINFLQGKMGQQKKPGEQDEKV